MFTHRPAAGFRRPVALVATALAAVLALTACESDGGGAESAKKSGTSGTATGSVVAPGKPGEPAKTLTPEQALKAVPDDSPNAADFAYTEMMVVHHTQALTMTSLVPGRAESAMVKGVADRIAAAQKPEIDAMNGWLKRFAAKRPKDSGGHDHGTMTMPGMATDAQLAQLRAAKGKAFDQLFLKLMITHHDGAVSMAADALSDGRNTLVQEMANDVISQQSAEIGRMRKM
ncbi:DUF305 domain-containing protein [Streptomyces qinzhouensis]|uniref:DUF305 domain-containing protein n=1 Tax=Streptomyces qinzhouensis TaxID=2599401 RepID=A0A5B8ICG2_9ACTN|nr:DUF305 domain-containing protein [Streptomyces qinzhouensis]QDY75522.1 DUF305 domain-containing protein [Streptomyces qinzhouensis]